MNPGEGGRANGNAMEMGMGMGMGMVVHAVQVSEQAARVQDHAIRYLAPFTCRVLLNMSTWSFLCSVELVLRSHELALRRDSSVIDRICHFDSYSHSGTWAASYEWVD